MAPDRAAIGVDGAQLFPEDVDAVTKYLSTYLASGSPPNAAK